MMRMWRKYWYFLIRDRRWNKDKDTALCIPKASVAPKWEETVIHV